MSLRIGDRAPAFELPYEPGATVDLADHLGRDVIVLLFFPLAFSRVCTDELCAVRDRWDAYRELDAVVLGISVDSPFVTSRFREAEAIPFRILSDFNRQVVSAYDVVYEDFWGLRGVAKRSAFVIDREGRIRYAWVTEDADIVPDYEALEAAVREATGRASPS